MSFSDALNLSVRVSGSEGEVRPVVDEKGGTYARMQLSFDQAMRYLRKNEPDKCKRIRSPVPGVSASYPRFRPQTFSHTKWSRKCITDLKADKSARPYIA